MRNKCLIVSLITTIKLGLMPFEDFDFNSKFAREQLLDNSPVFKIIKAKWKKNSPPKKFFK